jgi:hypothetical protein
VKFSANLKTWKRAKKKEAQAPKALELLFISIQNEFLF